MSDDSDFTAGDGAKAGCRPEAAGSGSCAKHDFAVKSTCDECPWRLDALIGRFPPERYRALAGTCEQRLGGPIFACHKTKEGRERACAGFLIVEGWNNLSVRIASSFKRFDMASITATAPLYGSFAEMARANGYEVRTDRIIRRRRRDPAIQVGTPAAPLSPAVKSP